MDNTYQVVIVSHEKLMLRDHHHTLRKLEEKSAQQKCLDLCKFGIEYFKRKRYEKIELYLREINKQKQKNFEKLEDILNLGVYIEKWIQATKITRGQLEDYKSDLNKKHNKIRQEINSGSLAVEEEQNKWSEFDKTRYTIGKVRDALNNLKQIPKMLGKLEKPLNELIPDQKQHLDRIKRGDSLNRFAGQEDLNDKDGIFEELITRIEIQNPTVKEAYLISERCCKEESDLLNGTRDNTNLTIPAKILNYINEINSILGISTSSESQNEITDTKPRHSDAGPSQPPESQLDLQPKLTEINKLPTYIDQLVQQYEKFEEVINEIERLEASHDKHIKILNNEKEKLGKKLGIDKKYTAVEAVTTQNIDDDRNQASTSGIQSH